MNWTTISKIQKIFLHKLFIRKLFLNISNFTNLSKFVENSSLNDDNFENLKKILQNKEIISNMKSFLNSLYRYFKISNIITPQKFLSSWMIASFPTYILEIDHEIINNPKNKNLYPVNIYLDCHEMIVRLLSLIVNPYDKHNLKLFLKSFFRYTESINIFIEIDKQNQLKTLRKNYCDMNETISEITNSPKYDDLHKRNCIDAIQKSQTKILFYAQKLDPNITKDDFENYSKIINLINQELENKELNFLISDIHNKKYVVFKNYIEMIKNELINLGNYHHNLKTELDDKLDANIIINSMNYSGFGYLNVDVYGDFMISIINSLEAPIHVKYTNESWNKLKTDKNQCDISEYLARMIFLIIKEIDLIKLNIENLNYAIEAGINIFVV